MTEQPLRCNNQIGGYCRNQLVDEAVVTTCSHIFCLDCATKTRFANAALHERSCPVCQTALPNHDDAVQARLSPSEDYKTSVLSGLDPNTIMECAGRALAFWTYQTTQEILYQEHMGKQLKDKYGQLNSAMDKIINEANTEISTLQNKVSAMSLDQRAIQEKYDDLVNLYRDKSKRCAQAQQLYDTLKKKFMLRDVETAASENVTQTLQSIVHQSRPRTDQEYSVPRLSYSSAAGQNVQRSELLQPDLLGTDLRPVNYAARRSSEAGRGNDEMAPPLRPVANRNAKPTAPDTPLQKTTLSLQGRATINRSQIPVSTRPDARFNVQNVGSIRHGVHGEGFDRAKASTPRGFGMLHGMRVGRAETADGQAMESRLLRSDGMY